ncbi:MAG: MFS transporter [Clostridia bacterium]|nr:MFS transporter [Clostridia bacterium]
MKKFTIIKELRKFLILWSSQAVSALGTAMTNYALTIWVYGQEGTASSTTLLTLCSFLPTILFRFIAGTLADCWDKKRIMLISDLAAACGTAAVLALYSLSALRIWHLYLINVLLSLMNAFQVPASYVATSLLVPKEHYARAGGLQGFAGAAVSILSPALGGVLLARGGLKLVLICDLASFAVAFLSLLLFIRLPEVARAKKEAAEPFRKSLMDGIRFLGEHKAILHLTLFLAVVNLLAKMGNDGMLAPFVLGRTGNDQQALGMVQSYIALGLLAGSLIVAVMKPAKNKTKAMFLAYAFVFSGNIMQSLSRSPWVWCAAAFATYMTAAYMNANLMAVLRECVPMEMQGRVFSVKDTLQNCTVPLGLLLGGVLADHVFEPMMAGNAAMQRIAGAVFGTGKGDGIALMFFIVGVLGCSLCLTRIGKPVYKELEK